MASRISSYCRALTIFLAIWIGNAACPENSAQAQGWETETVIDLGVIYTDNLRLAAEGMEESDYIYTIIPTFVLQKDGQRVDANIRYRPEILFYQETDDADSIYNFVDAAITTTLLNDALFLYASAISYQSIVSPDVIIPTTTIPISGNRLESRVGEIRPFWDQDLGYAQVLLEAGFVATRYDELEAEVGEFTQDNDQTSARFQLDNNERGEGVAWSIDYWGRRIEYENALPWEYQEASITLGYWLNGNFRAFGEFGVETPYDSLFSAAMDDEFWEAGFQYVTDRRLDIEIAAGKRSFGDTYRVRIDYQLRRGEFSLGYTEEPSSRAENMGEYRPILSADNLDRFLDSPFASDRFIRRRGELRTTIDLAQSSLIFRVFSEDREQRTTDFGVPLEDEWFGGAALRWQWNSSDNSSIGIDVDITQRETESYEDDLGRYAIDYSYYLTPRHSLVLLVQYSTQDGENTFYDPYAEKQVRLLLRTELR